jgi:thiamine-monophosphate kinase
LLGIGDDAAAWHGDTAIQLATVDTLIQDVHFSLDTASWGDVGWRAMAANLSDIAAMGGVPRYALVSLGLPQQTEVEDVTALYQGMLELGQQYGVATVGGDISAAPLLVITITILGSARNQIDYVLTRLTAEPGEQVAVTGQLVASAAGLQMLSRKLQFAPEAAACFRNAFFRPSPRIAEGQFLLDAGVRTAIDISDGLVADMGQVCKASQVGARIDISRVPVHPLVRENFGDKALEMALSGGEDYELLFTDSAEVMDRVKQSAPCPIAVIGEITSENAGEVTLVDAGGKPFELAKAGWEHFA